jgi:hypothetical protein
VSEYIFIFIFLFLLFSTSNFIFTSPNPGIPTQHNMATPEYDLIVVNGIVVTELAIRELDIAVRDGVIVKLVERGGLDGVGNAKRVVDAEGGWVMVSGDFWFSLWVWNMMLMRRDV